MSRFFERIWRCDCGGAHFVSVSRISFGDPYTSYLSVEVEYRADTLLNRIKVAWDILRHGRHSNGDVLLAPKVITELQQALADMTLLQTRAEEETENAQV